MNEYQTLLISALLHDLGKFMQGANLQHDSKYSNLSQQDFGYSGAHGKWSASFIRYLPRELQKYCKLQMDIPLGSASLGKKENLRV